MRTQRWTLVVVCAATAMLMLDIAVVNTAMSRIAEDLHTGLSGLQWVIDAYTLALATVVLSAGSLADRLGRKRLFEIGLSIFILSSLACALAQDITVLNAARAVQGIGAAIMFAVSLALLAHAFPTAKERAGALAAYGASIGASFAVGPLVGGALTSGLDWEWIFLVNLPIGIACLVITRLFVQESRDPNAHGIDWPGQITLGAGLFLLVLALLRGNEQGWGSPAIVAELAGAVAALIAFVAVERRVRQPMLPLRFFRNPAFTGAQIAAFAISASFFAVFVYTTLYLQQVLGIALIGTGLFNPSVSAVALGSVPMESSGVAAGVNDTFRQAGIAVGVAALGALIPAESVLGGGGAAAYVDGLHDALLVGAALAAVGAVAAALLIPRHFGAGAQVDDLATDRGPELAAEAA
jgi:EmrB/QacA subfamily drug resistance transporter